MTDIEGHPYSLRVDLPLPNEEQITQEQDCKFLQIFSQFQDWTDSNILNYIIGFELSEKGKPHLQSIIWFEEPLPQTTLSKYRNWWKKYSAETYQPVSLTKSIKPESLSIYCMKDKNFTTSLPTNITSQFPIWRDKLSKSQRLSKKELFLKLSYEYIQNNPEKFQISPTETITNNPYYNQNYKEFGNAQQTLTCINNPCYYLQYLETFSNIYYQIYNSPMRRHTGIHALMHLNILTHEDYTTILYKNFFSL